jgi:hypothetical protein
MTLTLILLLPFLGSIFAAVLPSNARNAEAWLAGAFALASTGLLIALYPQIEGGGVIRASLPWLPQLDLELQLRMDGFAWMFALLITGIGSLVVFYARYRPRTTSDRPAPADRPRAVEPGARASDAAPPVSWQTAARRRRTTTPARTRRRRRRCSSASPWRAP